MAAGLSSIHRTARGLLPHTWDARGDRRTFYDKEDEEEDVSHLQQLSSPFFVSSYLWLRGHNLDPGGDAWHRSIRM